jgi:hypothetical protein
MLFHPLQSYQVLLVFICNSRVTQATNYRENDSRVQDKPLKRGDTAWSDKAMNRNENARGKLKERGMKREREMNSHTAFKADNKT